ncbi:long-chain fatty-acid-CoA ligase [Marinomonas sp. MED121]|uniref:AMP-binding protein n=1 Tax=Marinomonas sp. MED121 TaxID=314277 RepID=UPI0000690071|nr:class I adenylate-forming enzyme family protein [Marinomonas sp. MED121]EAQ65678.1 long-chain fatty-acid-CoA ligase [Marinomonas sp. MED121]
MIYFSDRNKEIVALETSNGNYTFGDIYEKSNEISKSLKSMFQAQETILVSSENPFIFIASLFSLYECKMKFCCWNGDSDINDLYKLVSASGYLYIDNNEDYSLSKLYESTAYIENDGNFIITTSGSTGSPKGVSLKIENVINNAKLASEKIRFKDYNLEKWCIDTDLSLMSAISHLFMAWEARIPLVHLKGYQKKYISDLFSQNIVGFGGAPLQLTNLSNFLTSIKSKSLFISSGDFLTKENINLINKRHPDLDICSFYGLTELSGRLCYMSTEDIKMSPGAAGKEIIENSTYINTRNEVVANSPLLFEGYYRKNMPFEKNNGEFITGDIAKKGVDGIIWLEGRSTDTFKVSGLKVNRILVEKVLSKVLSGFEYCVLPVQHSSMGTCCALFIQEDINRKTPSLREIIKSIKETSPSIYIPVFTYIINNLPTLKNGKLDKQKLIKDHLSFKRHN